MLSRAAKVALSQLALSAAARARERRRIAREELTTTTMIAA
jgi:hypothetical protein